MNIRAWLIIWTKLRTLLALTVTPSTDGGFNKDVTEKIKLGDNLMNKIQRALRANIIDDQPRGTGGPGVAGGAPTTAGGPGGVGVPGKRLTNPYLDTTKSGDETSRYTLADVTTDDIEVATGQSRIMPRGFTAKRDSTAGENRRAYDGQSASEAEDRDKMEEFRRYVEQNPGLLERYMKRRAAGGGAAPDAQRLELAPARGARVASERLQGRVCQRSVLLPEGPKYDSRGRVYLAAFQRGARAFQHTRRPDLLLPRCCNCCRKSVLGCE